MDAHSWPEVLNPLSLGRDLTPDQAAWAMEQMLTGQATAAQFGAFVMGLRSKGETGAEVEALVRVMLEQANLLDFGPEGAPAALDIVGTGGDHAHTVNISTMAALVCAAAGVPIVKHGNRAASSSTGTADVLERLDVVIDLQPQQVVASVREAGIGFCFAQVHHPALRHVAAWRRELGVPTVFNILGPLTNPGAAPAALIGCANEALAPVMADVLHRRGVRALVVRGEDGLDEISLAAPTRVWDATGDDVVETWLDAADLGFARRDPSLLTGGDSARNAALLVAALGTDVPAASEVERIEAIRDAVAVNAAAALAAHACLAPGRETPADLVDRVREHLPRVREVLSDGTALTTLRAWAAVTRGLTT